MIFSQNLISFLTGQVVFFVFNIPQSILYKIRERGQDSNNFRKNLALLFLKFGSRKLCVWYLLSSKSYELFKVNPKSTLNMLFLPYFERSRYLDVSTSRIGSLILQITKLHPLLFKYWNRSLIFQIPNRTSSFLLIQNGHPFSQFQKWT